MCAILDYRITCYSLAMQRLTATLGVPLDANLHTSPAIRAAALAGKLDAISYRLNAAAYFAAAIGFEASLRLIREKQAELAALRAELRTRTPADPGKGKRGRAAAIVAWIRATGADASAVASRFGLARSTARGYVRRAQFKAK